MTYQELEDAIREIHNLWEAINNLSCNVKYFGDQIRRFNEYAERQESAKKQSILNQTPDEIGIVTRASNALHWFGIRTVGDLCDITYNNLLKVPKLGKTSIDKSILPSLHKYGLSLREE